MSGRIRTIKPEFFDDEKLASESDAVRLLAVGLISGADDYGNGRASPVMVRNRVWGYHENVSSRDCRERLARLSGTGFCSFYENNRETYYTITNWGTHQKVDKPGKPRVPGPLDKGSEPIELNSRDSRETLAPDHDPDQRSTIADHDQESSEVSPARKEPDIPSQATELATQLLDQITDRLPNNRSARNRERTVRSWAKTMDKIHRLDGHDWNLIRETLYWSQRDGFWQGNILSADKFRDKFDQLRSARKQKRSQGGRRGGGMTAQQVWDYADQLEAEERARVE